jgi:hypothetical protein
MDEDKALAAAKGSLFGGSRKPKPTADSDDAALAAAKGSLFGGARKLKPADDAMLEEAKGAPVKFSATRKPEPEPEQELEAAEVPPDELKADEGTDSNGLTHAQLVSMASSIGLDEELLEGMLEAFEGEPDAREQAAAMLAMQGATRPVAPAAPAAPAPAPTAPPVVALAPAPACGYIRIAAAEDSDPDSDSESETTSSAPPPISRAQLVAMAESVGLDEELLDGMLEAIDGSYAMAAEMLQAQGAPPGAETGASDATVPGKIIEEYENQYADGTGDSAAADGSAASEAPVEAPPAVRTSAGQAVPVAAEPGMSRREALAVWLVAHNFAEFAEEVGDALYDAEIPSSGWIHELEEMEGEGTLPGFFKHIQKKCAKRKDAQGKAELLDGGAPKQTQAARYDDDDPYAKVPKAIGASAAVLEAQSRVRENLEMLGDLADKTSEMQNNSMQFATMASQIRRKKQFGFF